MPLVIAAALALGACSTAQLSTAATDLNAVAKALNATAATLPGACTNLSSAITTVSSTPNLPNSIALALGDGNAKYSSYCQAGAAVIVATSVAVTDINTFIQALQASLAAGG